VGSRKIWRCDNCGASPSWTDVSGVHDDHRAFAWQSSRLIDADDGGIRSTTNRGGTWDNHNSTLAATQFFSGALHPTNPNWLLESSKDNGCAVWSGTDVWTASGSCEGEVAISTSHPETEWITATQGLVTIERTNGGRSALAQDGIDWTGAAKGVVPIRQCPAN